MKKVMRNLKKYLQIYLNHKFIKTKNMNETKNLKGEQQVGAQNEQPKGKMSKKSKITWASIGGVGVATAVVASVLYLQPNEPIEGFGGVSEVQDSINVELSESELPELLASMAPGSMPVAPGQEATDLESFQKLIEPIEQALKKKAENVLGQNQSSEEGERQTGRSEANQTDTNNGKVFEIPPIAVLFDYKSSNIAESGLKLLNEYASVYNKTNKQAKISVSGYTCDLGTDKLNDRLSKARAESVKDALIASGVPSDNISTYWYGKSKYKDFSYPSKSDYRRVVVTIQ